MIYKKASQLKLRFNTPKGLLSVEQLWSLSQTDLVNTLKEVKKTLNKNDDAELAFLGEEKEVDVVNQLTFDILKDIYLTKKEEAAAARTALEIKEYNCKIDEIIAKKQDQQLENLSLDELRKLRR